MSRRTGTSNFALPKVDDEVIKELAETHELLTTMTKRVLRSGEKQPISFLGIPREGCHDFDVDPTHDEADQRAAWKALENRLA